MLALALACVAGGGGACSGSSSGGGQRTNQQALADAGGGTDQGGGPHDAASEPAADAAGCVDACAFDGDSSCVDGARRVCERQANGCLALGPAMACASASCQDAVSCSGCVNGCTSPGLTLCDAGELVTCRASDSGCLAWSDPVPCEGGACGDASACGGCNGACPSAGATRCMDGQVQTCAAGSQGCLAWGAAVACASGACADARACAGCVDGCDSEGVNQCSGGELRRCTADQSGCLHWTGATPCPSGVCSSATSCVVCNDTCPSAGSTLCQAGTLSTCVADALGCLAYSDSSCEDGFCSGNACGFCNDTCSPSETRCAGGQLSTCSTDTNGCLDYRDPEPCMGGRCDGATRCYRCEQIIHVDADSTALSPDGLSWASAFPDLRQAATAASDRPEDCAAAEIWVAEGSYRPGVASVDRDKPFAFGRNGVLLLGGFAGTETSRDQRDPAAHLTVLSGDLARDDDGSVGKYFDNSRRLIHIGSAADFTWIDGFTIRAVRMSGGSVLGLSASQGLLSNLVLADNTAGTGVGQLVNFTGDALEVRDCVLVDNDAAGIQSTGQLEVDGLTVVGAGADSTFNYAVRTGAASTLRNLRMVNNASQPLIAINAPTRIENALFAGNAGRAIENGGELEVVNATFFANSEDIHSAAQYPSSVSNTVFTPTSAIGTTDSNYIGDPTDIFQGTLTAGNLASPTVSYDADRFQTTLTYEDASRTPGAFAGLLLDVFDLFDPSLVDPSLIVDNTATSVRVWGTPASSQVYLIRNLRPDGAPLADAANSAVAPCADLLGAGRVDIANVGSDGVAADIGAYEEDGSIDSDCPARCEHACPLADGTQCAGGWSRSCVAGSDGCRAWSAWSLCPTAVCEDPVACEEPVSCTDECPGADQTSCQSGQLRSCQTGGDGCLDWSAPSACASGSCESASACASEPLGVCDRSHVYQCIEYSDPAWTTDSARTQCESDGTWTTSCPAGTVLGRCVDSGAPPYETTISHYDGTPVTVEQLTSACTAAGGSWQ